MDAIVTAGGIPNPGDPLYEYTQGKNKAMLDIAGKPMIQWVLDALEGAKTVQKVIIAGLNEAPDLKSTKVIKYVPNQGGMLDNIREGARAMFEIDPTTNHLLTVSSDIPAITPEMIDWLAGAASATDHDAYYNIISREVMEARYPESRRSYVRLRGMEVCGGDMNVLRARIVLGKEDLWERIIDSRKNVLKQAALIGYDTLFRLVFRQLTIECAEKTAYKRLGISARALICPYAEIGMDVDKPHQLEIIRSDLERMVVA
jgi:GTP:adenosylcobinamide-phosphate guanylyltransferase